MRNDTQQTETRTPTTPFATPAATRRASRRRRLGRRRLIAGGAVLTAGLVAGTGVTMQSALAANERVQATAAITDAAARDTLQLGAYAGIAEAKTHAQAEDTLELASDTLADVEGKVDADGLAASVASLGDYEALPLDEVRELTAETKARIAEAMQAAEAHDRAEAERVAAAEAQARANTPEGAKQSAREIMASQYGWGADQFQCLDSLWTKESGWNYQAVNPTSGAYGIVQAWPADKLATAGADWRTNAATQIKWGLQYISASYGTPCAAWGHSQAVNWY
ncbi:aggregation-promoting factor C-terminal-like domain-containing protein [Agromyces sp. ZXT2-6]|uniref:aggregation-promoting factor C-terminal-like domain-containing protein n=1 Tax=Agromyces sp. ZXT2-6 TaxID=3461153 RepID=UPI0040553225